MKKLSIRLKITLWFAFVLVLMVVLTYTVLLYISDAIMQKVLQNNLVETVEDNVDEIEYYSSVPLYKKDSGTDLYIAYGKGYLEIDDDFLDKVNGISTGLYRENGLLLYGENPISTELSKVAFVDMQVQKKTVRGEVWYVFDRMLTTDGLEGLWLRGTVSSAQGHIQLSAVVHLSLILMPILMLLAIFGGYFIAGRALAPMKQIAQTAAQIGQGRDLKRRIALGDGDDELHQLANTFDEMFQRLETSFETERQFTSDASHELRTPMAVVMAECEYTLEQQRECSEYEDALRVIHRQGRKMSRLIADMLAFTRMERKADDFKMEWFDFSELVRSVCEDMERLQDKNISLTSDVEPNIVVDGNRDLLARLLTNLISNAYRYGRENGHITVTLSSDGNEAALSVADDGIGVPMEEQEKIFLRFYQSDGARSNGGTGLGLAMVREIAELHRGKILVESVPGKGSTFLFKISKK